MMDNWIVIRRGLDKLFMAVEEPEDHYDYSVVVGEDGAYLRFPDKKSAENWAIDALMEVRTMRDLGIFREIPLSR